MICRMVLLGLSAWLFSASVQSATLPEGALQQGTLSNQILIQDAMMGVASKVAILGCNAPEEFFPYVLEMPKGDPGLRHWRELWLVSGCGQQYPVKIIFQESGPSAANYTIEK